MNAKLLQALIRALKPYIKTGSYSFAVTLVTNQLLQAVTPSSQLHAWLFVAFGLSIAVTGLCSFACLVLLRATFQPTKRNRRKTNRNGNRNAAVTPRSRRVTAKKEPETLAPGYRYGGRMSRNELPDPNVIDGYFRSY
jgi:hypothetical protein